jgi:hypothetical protein
MRKALVPVAHHHIRATGHTGMHGVLPQKQAVFRVHRIGWNATDDITGVDVFNRHRFAPGGKMLGDLVA